VGVFESNDRFLFNQVTIDTRLLDSGMVSFPVSYLGSSIAVPKNESVAKESLASRRYAKAVNVLKGIPIITSKSQTLAIEVVESSKDTVVFKLRQEYTPRLLPTRAVNRYLKI
jgi:hypothetical protein